MTAHATGRNVLNLKIEADELSESQVRLIKSINSLLVYNMTIDEEAEYFESSAQLLNLISLAIRESNFLQDHNKSDKKNLGNQAIEYALESLIEGSEKLHFYSLDN